MGKPTAFASAMMWLAIDAELRLHLGHQARKRAVRELSNDIVTYAWFEFYRRRINITVKQTVDVI